VAESFSYLSLPTCSIVAACRSSSQRFLHLHHQHRLWRWRLSTNCLPKRSIRVESHCPDRLECCSQLRSLLKSTNYTVLVHKSIHGYTGITYNIYCNHTHSNSPVKKETRQVKTRRGGWESYPSCRSRMKAFEEEESLQVY
jgi:hypothetical protein